MDLKLNVGISGKKNLIWAERKKIEYAMKYGVNYIANVSLCKIPEFEEVLIKNYIRRSNTKFIGLPMYEACELNLPFMQVLQRHLDVYDGVTIHMTPLEFIKKFQKNGGIINSRGGFYASHFEEKQHSIESELNHIGEMFLEKMKRGLPAKLFIGSICRPGKCSYDYKMYFEEQKLLLDIYDFYVNLGIDVELEFGGHMVLTDEKASEFKKITGRDLKNVNFCILGPMQSDSTGGRDNINGALGTQVFSEKIVTPATACIITPAEHLRFPTIEDTKEGIRTYLTLKEVVNEQKSSNIKSYSFATCNSTYTVIDKGEKYNNKAITNCGMCGRDQCPLKTNYYIELKNLTNRLVEMIGNGSVKDIVVVGGPFVGKSTIISKFILPAIRRSDHSSNLIAFGNLVREKYGPDKGSVPIEELDAIFKERLNLDDNVINVIDNPVKKVENISWFKSKVLPSLRNPVVLYVKRVGKRRHIYWHRSGRDDKKMLESKIFFWKNITRKYVEKMMCELNCSKYVIENFF